MEVGDWRILRSSGVKFSMEGGDEGDVGVLEGGIACATKNPKTDDISLLFPPRILAPNGTSCPFILACSRQNG